ncbi:synaptic vesicle glycoprotein 2B-like isoform X1 [Synchiropus splendidus]|uniref:synaptic vesicle glycoprotein 2B-like isoform X1 n=1 Tax=Synchiropus splendidus TaxID=270530 RepID=UPI00237D57BF|nr:synaptic vesicle glycoprotein 2B-like isoform X1 [Synchiropus splendidus]
MSEPYQNSCHQAGDSYPPGYQTDGPPQDEDAASDATEGRDEEDQMYEGEYQGIPHPDEVKAAQRAARAKTAAAAGARSELEELSEQYEDIMEDCGHGRFQWTLFMVLGLALMGDGVECFVVAFVLPSAEKDLCLSHAQKGTLGLVVFLSMMAGAFLWGGLADKAGRRRCLTAALAVNCVFAFLSSFAQGYGFFLFFRLLSGIGIGGSVPIVYSYFSEFLQMDKRGEHLSWLCMFWMVGGIYASLTAWAIIPRSGWGFSMGTELHFHSWRVFVLVAALPAITSLVGLTFMPESPRFLLENAKHDEAWMILKQVHDTNWRAKGQPEKVFTVTHIKAPKTAEDEFIEIQAATGTRVQRWAVRWLALCRLVLRNVASLLSAEFRLATLFMAIVWFCMAFSYYGLSVWFPDMIKHLQRQEYQAKVKLFHGEQVHHFTFNFSLENQIHREGQFVHDKPAAGAVRGVQDGEQQPGARPARLPAGGAGAERRPHLPGQLPGQSGRPARQHHLGSLHGEGRPSQDHRWLHAGVGRLLLPSLPELQPGGHHRSAVPLLRRQRGGLERHRGGDGGALPHLQEGHSLRRPQRAVQTGGGARQRHLRRLRGSHHGGSHPAVLRRVGVWRPGGAEAPRHPGKDPPVSRDAAGGRGARGERVHRGGLGSVFHQSMSLQIPSVLMLDSNAVHFPETLLTSRCVLAASSR